MNYDIGLFVENISIKYAYSDEVRELLSQIIPKMILYYGEDKAEIILNAIQSCPIMICNDGENIYDLLFKEGFINTSIDSDYTVSNDDLKRSSGVYTSVPELIYDDETNKYMVKSVRRIVGLSNYFKYDEINHIAILVHELGHLVKSYVDEYIIIDDVLISRSGLIVSTYRLSHDGNVVSMKLIDEKSVGIEEGTNSLDEKNIMSSYFDNSYKVEGYVLVTEVARVLVDNFDLKKDIHDAQFFATKNNLIEKYNSMSTEYSYQRLDILVDETIRLEYEKFSNIFEPEKLEESNQKLNNQIDKLKQELSNLKLEPKNIK